MPPATTSIAGTGPAAAAAATPTPEEKDRLAAARFKQRMLAAPLVGFPLAFAGYFALTAQKGPAFFHLHPLLMMVGYVALAGNAITMKKVVGFENTKWHGYVMFLASVAAWAGGWVIWQNKENFGKAHITTTHATIGAFTLCGSLYPVMSWYLYNPVDGVKRTDKTYRLVHRYTGRFWTVMSFAAIFTGVLQVEKDPMKQAAILGSLGLLLPFLVL